MASIHSSPGRTKFGADPVAYDFARPEYSEALFGWLAERARLNAQSDCLEIGAGTGHATLPVLAMPVRYLMAIEPDPRLAVRLREKAGHDPRLVVEEERFETAIIPQAFFDVAFAATSFHWVPRMKSLAKVRDALKPGGRFAMWWHVYHNAAKPDAFDIATTHLFNGLEQDLEATSGRPPFALDAASRTGELRSAGFTDIEHQLFQQQLTFSPERLAALYGTFSRVHMAPEPTRDHLLSEVSGIAREQFGGEVRRTIITSAFIARRP